MDSQRTDSVEERYLDVHEAAALLEVSETELWDLAHQHKLPTHTIAGAFLRFKTKDIEEVKIKWRIERALFPKRDRYFVHQSTVGRETAWDRVRDFWHFNDFYVLCSVLALTLLYFILSAQ